MSDIIKFAVDLESELITRLGYDGTLNLGNHIINAVRVAGARAKSRDSAPYPMVTTFEGHSEQEIRIAFAALKWAKNCAMPVLKYYDAQNAGTWKRTMAQQVIDDAPQEIK